MGQERAELELMPVLTRVGHIYSSVFFLYLLRTMYWGVMH